MSAVAAVFFDGRSSRAQRVQLNVESGALAIDAGDWQRSALLSAVRVTPRVAGIHRTLLLSDGSQLQVEDNDAVDAWFPHRDRSAALIDRLERHSVAVAAALLVTVVGFAGLIFFGIPYAANKVAAYIPDSVARAMGEQSVTLLNHFGFSKSALPQQRRDELNARFTRYVADLPDPAHYQLRFMKAHMANAFALPGGIIVVTDEMVNIIDGRPATQHRNNAGVPAPASGSCKGHEEYKPRVPAEAGHQNATVDSDKSAANENLREGKAVRSAPLAAVASNVADHDKADANNKASAAGADTKDEDASDDDEDDNDDDDADTAADKSASNASTVAGATAAPDTNVAADERILAVVAHEIGHEENRHVLRSVLQDSGIVLIGAYVTGDVSSASALVVSVPTFLLDSHYSRNFESEADQYAFTSLAAHGISPARFAEVMSMLMKAEPAFRRQESGYLSTHPATGERIMKATEAATLYERERNRVNQ